MSNIYRYYAFLSYCHEDADMAEDLQRKLERFRLPHGVHNECCESKRLYPIFHYEASDRGVLSDEIKEQLLASKCLILICSPEAAESEIVNQEIKLFIAEGRIKQIIPYIVSGVPMCNGAKECFPLALVDYFKENPSRELLGIDTQRISGRSALYSVISTLLDIPYNKLSDRLARIRRRSIALAVLFCTLLLGLILYLAVPYRIHITLVDDNHHLPIIKDANGVVGIFRMAGVETPVYSLDTTITSPPVPGFLRGKSIPCSFEATYYLPTLDTIQLGYILTSSWELRLHRDNEFEIFAGRVLDLETGRTIPGAWVEVDNGKFWAVTDSLGHFKMRFSLEEQSESKSVRVNASGYKDYFDDQTIIDQNVRIGLEKKK